MATDPPGTHYQFDPNVPVHIDGPTHDQREPVPEREADDDYTAEWQSSTAKIAIIEWPTEPREVAIVKRAHLEITELTEQRDDLLAACQAYMAGDCETDLVPQMKAAIARATREEGEAT